MADESITVTDPNDTRDLDAFLGIKPEKPWAKWGVRGGIAILLLILILLLTRCLTDGNAAQYATQEVERGDLTVTVSATGNLKPINQVDVGSEQSRSEEHTSDPVTNAHLVCRLLLEKKKKKKK